MARVEQLTIEARSIADLSSQLVALDHNNHEARLLVTATYNGESWATLEVQPLTDTCRSIFPTSTNGVRGDTRRRSHAGVIDNAKATGRVDTLRVVINRARRMANR